MTLPLQQGSNGRHDEATIDANIGQLVRTSTYLKEYRVGSLLSGMPNFLFTNPPCVQRAIFSVISPIPRDSSDLTARSWAKIAVYSSLLTALVGNSGKHEPYERLSSVASAFPLYNTSALTLENPSTSHGMDSLVDTHG